jgi:hypothetical protein
MSGGTGNLVVKVNVKKNMDEGLMMASAELVEAWVSSGKTDLVSDKANMRSLCCHWFGSNMRSSVGGEGGRTARSF